MGDRKRRDLVVLVADKDMKSTLEALLARTDALQIGSIEFDIYAHTQKDPGCRTNADAFLRTFLRSHEYALVLFDRDGCGDVAPREQIESDVYSRLGSNGWEGRCQVVVIDPELEAWVWSRSPHVADTLGWDTRVSELNSALVEKGYLVASGDAKPSKPKEAMETALRNSKTPWSSSLFSQLAQRVSFQRCEDAAFEKLKRTLQQWFPKQN